jgi:hypothetical protein
VKLIFKFAYLPAARSVEAVIARFRSPGAGSESGGDTGDTFILVQLVFTLGHVDANTRYIVARTTVCQSEGSASLLHVLTQNFAQMLRSRAEGRRTGAARTRRQQALCLH